MLGEQLVAEVDRQQLAAEAAAMQVCALTSGPVDEGYVLAHHMHQPFLGLFGNHDAMKHPPRLRSGM